MGITNAILKVKEHRKSEKTVEVNFLVDSGAVYSLVPGKILDELDIERQVDAEHAPHLVQCRTSGDDELVGGDDIA